MSRSRPDLFTLAPGTRAMVAATWAFRTRAERESELRFRRLAGELDNFGATPVVIGLARDAAHDEHRHSQLCAALCARYGGEVPQGPAHDHPATRPGLGPRDRTLYELVSFSCIAETINAHLLIRILRTATAPEIVRVVRRLLKDEVMHSRLGWAHLAAERRAGRGEFLTELLPDLLSGSVEPELFQSGPEPIDAGIEAEAVAHGELSRAARLAIFRDAVSGAILPGCEMFGLDTSASKRWLESLEAKSSLTKS